MEPRTLTWIVNGGERTPILEQQTFQQYFSANQINFELINFVYIFGTLIIKKRKNLCKNFYDFNKNHKIVTISMAYKDIFLIYLVCFLSPYQKG